MSKINARSKGNSYERRLVIELKELLGTEKIYTTRNMNKLLDAEKVDICGEVPWHIQAKAWEKTPPIHEILKAMPTDKPQCIFWKKNRQTELVIMSKEEFYKILNSK